MTTDPLPVDPEESDQKKSAESTRRLERLHVGAGRSEGGRSHWRWLGPIVALVVAVAIAWALVATRRVPEKIEPVVPTPLVRIATMQPETRRLTLVARGTVEPRTESDLVAEVRGRVLRVSPKLVVGGFFSEGDELLSLDDREHRIARDSAQATVLLRESEARLATADAERRRQLARRGVASAADLEQFESRELVARAALDQARASLEQAELDLERTIVRAPFDGRVREREVDLGQFVSPGQKLGRLFAVDYAEVRLPIQTDDLAHLDVALDGAGAGGDLGGAEVLLSGRLGGAERTWPARLVRAEAAIDEQTRMLHVVARVDDPYQLGLGRAESGTPIPASPETSGVGSDQRVPLPAGLFVEARIAGRVLEDVFVVPPMALRDGDRVFVVDEEERLRVRDVSIVRQQHDAVVVDGGLEPGDRVVISPLRVHTEGMALRVVEASEP